LPSTGFALSVLWTAGLSTMGGYGLYWLCLRRATATRVASVLYLSPPITMLWAWAMFNEPLSWQMAVGMAVSGIGIWLVVGIEARQARHQACGREP
jgi:drug/metabolite transporter (DMT)-like permease